MTYENGRHYNKYMFDNCPERLFEGFRPKEYWYSETNSEWLVNHKSIPFKLSKYWDSDILKKFEYSVAYTGYRTRDRFGKCHNWRIGIKNKETNREYYFDYSSGIGIKFSPLPEDIIYCLISDYSFADYNYYDYCDEMGIENYEQFPFGSNKGWIALQEEKIKIDSLFSSQEIKELQELFEDF